MPILDYITDKRNRIVIGASGGIGLIVAAAVGISSWTPAFQVRDSSGQDVWNVDVAGRETASGAYTNKTLLSCNTIDSTSTGMLICGTDATGAGGSGNFGTGNVVTIGDSRYVNTSGDTMTGALKVRATVSGSVLHADNALTSSGGLRWMGNGSGNSLWLSDLDGVVISSDNMETSDFGVFSCIAGVGCLLDANTVSSSQITDDSIGTTELDDDSNTPAAGAFVIVETGDVSFDYLTANAGTDITADLEEETHATEHNEGGADALTVESLVSSCTDAQVIGGNGAGGAECQTDANTTYTAGQGLSLVGTAFSTNAILSGSLVRFTTVSGSTVYAKNSLTSSGTLEVLGMMSGARLNVSGAINGSGNLVVKGTSTLQSTLNVTGLVTLTDDLTINGGNINFGTTTIIGDGGDAITINSNGTLTVQDILDVSDNNITNVANIAVDTISSDESTSIGITLGVDAGDDLLVDTNTLVVEGDNNRVGIGQTSPLTALDVIGTISGSLLSVGIGTVTVPALSFSNDANTGLYWIGTDIIGISTGGAERMRIDAAGNVGIGTTVTANAKLNVAGTLSGYALTVSNGSNSINGTTTLSGSVTARSLRSCWTYQQGFSDMITAAAIGTGGIVPYYITPLRDKMTLSGAWINAGVSGTTGLSTVQVKNITQGTYFFSTPIALGSGRTSSGVYATAVTPIRINKGDLIAPWVVAVAGTPPKGLQISLQFCP